MHYPEGHFVRVTDDVKPRREYTIPVSALQDGVHEVLDKPATSTDGQPLAPKYTPEALGDAASDVPPTELPPYGDRKVKELEAEIDARNEGRDEDELISKSGNKPDLVAALEADDAHVEEPPPVDAPESLSDSSGQQATTTEGDV